MIFYFTATGNSLYVAKLFSKNPISIPQAIHEKELNFSAPKIGIICPVIGHELPPIVQDFLKAATFETNYFYMILTYGHHHGGASELAYKFCQTCGITPQYINVLLMADNWLPDFDMDEQRKIDKKVDAQIVAIYQDIKAEKKAISPVTDEDRAEHRRYAVSMSNLPEGAWENMIYIPDICEGCGTCVKVCPTGSLCIKNGKAVHSSENCQTCFACVHACPQKGIGLNLPEKNPNARYRNEHIELEEIIAANCQQN